VGRKGVMVWSEIGWFVFWESFGWYIDSSTASYTNMPKLQEVSTLRYIARHQIPDSKVTSHETDDHMSKWDHMIEVSGLVSRSHDRASGIISGCCPVLSAFRAKPFRYSD